LKSTTRIVILWTVRRRRPANELRIAIDCLPLISRQAMLDGIDSNRIIVGAYTDRQGGVCPMLAAHRKGGRTSLASFAKAWDRYTNAGKGPRPASERELLTLRTMLEASIAIDSGVDEELQDLVAAHKARKAHNGNGHGNGHPVPTGETDRTDELRHRHGWAWLRLFRRYDAYEIALEQLREAEKTEEDATERLPVG
jgi:hypothetical protein